MPKKMNPVVKLKWVEALRSGRYAQGQNRLRRGQEFCCLGVLCDLYDPDLWGNPTYPDDAVFYQEEEAQPPVGVLKWADLEPEVYLDEWQSPDHVARLWELNDRGYTFEQIADLIEAQL